MQDPGVDADGFNIFHLWSQLLGEMFSIFSWYEGALDPEVQEGVGVIMKGLSIFAGTTTTAESVVTSVSCVACSTYRASVGLEWG